jgi:hypothetical protein
MESQTKLNRQMVFKEAMSSKEKFRVVEISLLGLGFATAVVITKNDVDLIVFGTVVAAILVIAMFGAYVSFSGTKIICDQKGFQITEKGEQRRRSMVIRRVSILLFVVSLATIITIFNFFPYDRSIITRIFSAMSWLGIVFGFCGFLLGRKLILPKESEAKDMHFAWDQVTRTRIVPVGDEDNFVFVVEANDSEVLRFASGAGGFRNLLTVFNENAPHLPYQWVDESRINNREIIQNIQKCYFQIARN